jgi:hypothetical protein
MLRITRVTPTQLILEENRLVWRGAIFIVISILAFIALCGQGYQVAVTREPTPEQTVVFLLFLLIELGFIALSVLTLTVLGQGVRVVFDKPAATVTITVIRLWKPRSITHSIYSVSHLHIEKNEEMRVYGLFLSPRCPIMKWSMSKNCAAP